jgi:hypothetical protein
LRSLQRAYGSNGLAFVTLPSESRGRSRRPNSPIDDIILVEMLQRQHQLGNIEPRPLFRKPTLLLQVPEELPPALVVRHKIELLLRLERELEADEEGALERGLKDTALADGVGDLLFGDDLLLGEDLHGVDPFGVALADLEDAAEGASANELEKLEVARGEVLFGLMRGEGAG